MVGIDGAKESSTTPKVLVAEIEMRQEYSNFICRRTDMVRGAHVREMTPAGKLSRPRVPVWAMRPLTSPSSTRSGSWLTTLEVYEHLDT